MCIKLYCVQYSTVSVLEIAPSFLDFEKWNNNVLYVHCSTVLYTVNSDSVVCILYT